MRTKVAVAALSALLPLAGCSDTEPSATPTPTVTVTVTATQSAGLLDLRTVCDHVAEAFRSGDLGDADQDQGLALELQGMIDLAQPAAGRALIPLRDAAQAIADTDQESAPRPLIVVENRAVERLRQTCRAAGSHGLD